MSELHDPISDFVRSYVSSLEDPSRVTVSLILHQVQSEFSIPDISEYKSFIKECIVESLQEAETPENENETVVCSSSSSDEKMLSLALLSRPLHVCIPKIFEYARAHNLLFLAKEGRKREPCIRIRGELSELFPDQSVILQSQLGLLIQRLQSSAKPVLHNVAKHGSQKLVERAHASPVAKRRREDAVCISRIKTDHELQPRKGTMHEKLYVSEPLARIIGVEQASLPRMLALVQQHVQSCGEVSAVGEFLFDDSLRAVFRSASCPSREQLSKLVSRQLYRPEAMGLPPLGEEWVETDV